MNSIKTLSRWLALGAVLFPFTGTLSSTSTLQAQEESRKPSEKTEETVCQPDKLTITHHSLQIDGETLNYTANIGMLTLKDEHDKPSASIFYVAYLKEDVENLTDRPITFCFNGGPGASSVWLHLGAFGPRRVEYVDLSSASAPYQLQDNPYTLLTTTDLVFVDPVSTGFSRAASGREAKEFYGVDEDVQALSEFIRLFIARQKRWDSPKFLMGESYGTTRCAALSSYLQRKKYIYVNGLVLISSALNWATFRNENDGNDLPYLLYLPTYASAAWYHKRLDGEWQNDRQKLVEAVERFALREYALALLQGDQLSIADRNAVALQLQDFTGIAKEVWLEHDLRLDPYFFARLLLRSQGEMVGRFDSRYTGRDPSAMIEFGSYDPSFDAIAGLFNGTLNTYVRQELDWCTDTEYFAINTVTPWNFRNGSSGCLNVADDLQKAMWHSPSLRVFFASGEYDLATPYFATLYTINHLREINIAKRIDSKRFAAGHMMFLNVDVLKQLQKDVVQFYSETLKPTEQSTLNSANSTKSTQSTESKSTESKSANSQSAGSTKSTEPALKSIEPTVKSTGPATK